MATPDKPSAREVKRLQTRERLIGAAIAEFKRAGMADADVDTIVAAAGVAHGTFFFHFPTKEHVLLELERREEERISRHFTRHVDPARGVDFMLHETVQLVRGLERRLGALLFKDFIALRFSTTRPVTEGAEDHPIIALVAREIERAKEVKEADPDVNAINSAVFFLLGLYALLVSTHDWPMQGAMLQDYVKRTRRSLGVRRNPT